MEYLYVGSFPKMIGVSFYKPMDYFSGMFNRFVTWMTVGSFCHTELVVQATPATVMEVIKDIYAGASKNNYHPEDRQRILTSIESNFFDNRRFRGLAQSSDMMWISFSLLWGQPMTVRALEPTHHDSWFRIPSAETDNMELRYLTDITEDHVRETLKFSVEELGKDYDTTGALCSWLPWGSTPQQSYDTYFCSQFVVTAFQRLGYMPDLSATHTTPNTLYHYMGQHMNTTQ